MLPDQLLAKNSGSKFVGTDTSLQLNNVNFER